MYKLLLYRNGATTALEELEKRCYELDARLQQESQHDARGKRDLLGGQKDS